MEKTQTNLEELLAFTELLSDTVFGLASESDGFYEMYTSDDRLIPESYIIKYMGDKLYSTIMKSHLRNILLEEFTLNPSELEDHRNGEGILEYIYTDFDYYWVFADYIRKQFESEPNANYVEIVNNIIFGKVRFQEIDYLFRWDLGMRDIVSLVCGDKLINPYVGNKALTNYIKEEMKLLGY